MCKLIMDMFLATLYQNYVKNEQQKNTLQEQFENSIENCKKEQNREELEDTKGVIRIRILKKNRQQNGQKKKDNRTNNDLQNIHIKLKIE